MNQTVVAKKICQEIMEVRSKHGTFAMEVMYPSRPSTWFPSDALEGLATREGEVHGGLQETARLLAPGSGIWSWTPVEPH